MRKLIAVFLLFTVQASCAPRQDSPNNNPTTVFPEKKKQETLAPSAAKSNEMTYIGVVLVLVGFILFRSNWSEAIHIDRTFMWGPHRLGTEYHTQIHYGREIGGMLIFLGVVLILYAIVKG
jgi:hypothetical protein